MPSSQRTRTVRALQVLFALSACACSGATTEQVDQQAKTAAAAAATAELAGAEWLRGSVPQDYAMRTIIAARTRIEESEQQIDESASSDATARTDVARLKPIVVILADLQAVVKQGDRIGAERALNDLKSRRAEFLSSVGGA